MMKRIWKVGAAVMICILVMISSEASETDAFTGQVIQQGATGDDVIEHNA